MAEFSWDSVVDVLNSNSVPEILLMVMGFLILAIVMYYRQDKESGLYKGLMILGVVVGVFMVYVGTFINTGWSIGTLMILTVACFALIIRPIRNINIAVVIGLIVAIWVYIMLPDLVAGIEGPLEFVKAVGDGIPRLVVSIVAGGFIYMMLQFVQAVISLAGKILNAWPFLAVIGIWCIVESIFLLLGYNSTYDFIMSYVG